MLAWLTRFIERHPLLHRGALLIWRLFPPRLAGFLKGVLTRSWVVGVVAVIIDDAPSPPEVLLVEHSYRTKGAWGLPGGSLESITGNPQEETGDEPAPDDVIEAAIRQEVWEELGLEVTVIGLLRVDAIPFIAEEPGPYRLHFYFRCTPRQGIESLRQRLESGQMKPHSAEIKQIRFVPLTDLQAYDLFSSDVRFLQRDLPRLEPTLMASVTGSRPVSALS